MKNGLAIIAICLFAGLAFAQERKQAPPAKLTYAQGHDQALKSDKDLLVYVGIPSKPASYAIVCETPSLPGYPAKCRVHCTPVNGVLMWVQTTDENGKIIAKKAS